MVGQVEQEEATGHDDPETICVTGTVAVVVFIERKKSMGRGDSFLVREQSR